MNNEKIEEQERMENRIIEIYEELQKKLLAAGDNVQVSNITYYKNIQIAGAVNIENEQSESIMNDNIGGIDLSETYVVQIINEENEIIYEIYDEDIKIATINTEGKIQFSEEYKDMLLKAENGVLFIQEVENLESKKVNIKESQEETMNEMEAGERNLATEKKRTYEKEDIENLKNEKEQEQETGEVEEQDTTEEEQKEVIAQKMGMDKTQILSCEKIPPKSLVTESESFEEIAGIEDKYKEIFVVAVNRVAGENKKFEFVGIDEEGKAEEITELSTRGATTTDKSVYTMNKDGSVVEEKQVTQLFNTNTPNKNFSITMGDYGKIEVDYLRMSVEEKRWIGSPVETTKQERIQSNVKRHMDEKYTSKYDITEEIRNAEHQLGRGEQKGELESRKTNLEGIDTKEGNERYTNYDEEIILADDVTTTIRKEAEKQDVEVDQYVNMLEKAEGDCLADKIQNTNQELQEEKDIDEREIGDRERLTPEEIAQEEEYRKQFYNMKDNM